MSPTLPPEKRCPRCGAENVAVSSQCWLCQSPFSPNQEIFYIDAELADEQPNRAPSFRPEEFAYMVLTGLLTSLIVMVAVGLSLRSANFGIGYMVLAAIPLTTAGAYLLIRRSRGKEVTWGHRLLALCISFAAFLFAFVAIAVILAVAVVIFLLYVCTGHSLPFR